MAAPRPDQRSSAAAHTGRFFGRLLAPFAVDRRVWAAGSAAIFVVGAALIASADDVSHSVGAFVARLSLVAFGGWGIAWLITGGEGPVRRRGWLATVLLLVFIVGPVFERLYERALPSVFGVGWGEQVMAAPALGASLMIGCGVLRLSRTVSAVLAGLLIFASVFAVFNVGSVEHRVSSATTAQLERARDDGGTILLNGRSAGPQEDPVEARAPASSNTCRTLDVTDQRHTLIGMPGRRLELTFEACWRRSREPISLSVQSAINLRDETGEQTSVQLVPGDPFDPTRASGSGAQANLEADTVTARVRNKGNQIDVVVAYESTDGVDRRDGPTLSSEEGVERIAGARPPVGTAIDVVVASLSLAGGSSARLTRITSRGEHLGPTISSVE